MLGVGPSLRFTVLGLGVKVLGSVFGLLRVQSLRCIAKLASKPGTSSFCVAHPKPSALVPRRNHV